MQHEDKPGLQQLKRIFGNKAVTDNNNGTYEISYYQHRNQNPYADNHDSQHEIAFLEEIKGQTREEVAALSNAICASLAPPYYSQGNGNEPYIMLNAHQIENFSTVEILRNQPISQLKKKYFPDEVNRDNIINGSLHALNTLTQKAQITWKLERKEGRDYLATASPVANARAVTFLIADPLVKGDLSEALTLPPKGKGRVFIPADIIREESAAIIARLKIDEQLLSSSPSLAR